MAECPIGPKADSDRMAEPEIKKNVVLKEIVRDLVLAMRSGHNLGKDVGEPVILVERRAVVVAVRYSIDKRGASGSGLELELELESTSNDGRNIYNMLRYEKNNILLLCEGIGLERHEKPTRPNIINGRKWLSFCHTATHNDSVLFAGEQVEEDSASLSPNPSDQSSSNESEVVLGEELPYEGIKMDRIKARMFAWGACHRLQYASEHDDQRGGFFTNAFTTAMKAVTKDTKVRDLHALVDKIIMNESIQANQQDTQFCQLWTSGAGRGNKDKEAFRNELLDLPVWGNL
ncbi:unnamed protein product [Rhizoctonia solani]|uniref:Uncharacterized protein n=1 Tax=Rhizoctonia solani TaxID=456999 RepID=A0A8H2WLL5_9AGAM|nr:unnamed protein product [Rhizoctonia solani]